jgi:hypothetical protein
VSQLRLSRKMFDWRACDDGSGTGADQRRERSKQYTARAHAGLVAIVAIALQWQTSVVHALPSAEAWRIAWLGCTPADETPYFSLTVDTSGFVSYVGGPDVDTKTQNARIPARTASRLLKQLQKAAGRAAQEQTKLAQSASSTLCMRVGPEAKDQPMIWLTDPETIGRIDARVRRVIPVKQWACPALAHALSASEYCGPVALSFFKRDADTCEVQYGAEVYADRVIHFWARGTAGAKSHAQDHVSKLTPRQYSSLWEWIQRHDLDNGCCTRERHPVPITRVDGRLTDELQQFVTGLSGIGLDPIPRTRHCEYTDEHLNMEPFLLIRPEYFPPHR